jgi:hypothetical protein
MLNSISWTQYLVFVVLLLIAYYLFVGLKFYLFELSSLLKGKRLSVALAAETAEDDVIGRSKHFQDNQVELFPTYNRYAPQVQETDDTFQQVEELTTKLKEVIADAASNNTIKEEFIRSLQLVLKEYHFLKGSPFLVAINNLIASECDKHNFIRLTADERVLLWN